MWIRIRIRNPDTAIFVIDLQDANKKQILKKVFFCLLVLFEGTFTSFFIFKDKKSKRSPKTVEKHVDPVNPDSDPEHCLELGHEDPRIVDQAVYAGHQFRHLPTPIGTQLVEKKKNTFFQIEICSK